MHNYEQEEILEIINSEGETIGSAPRSEIHGNPSLVHRVVHVLVFNKKGELLLQKRSMNKDVAPGRWDTSVGGHVNPKEELYEAALREMKEELGLSTCQPEFLYSYTHANTYETESVHTFTCICEKESSFNKDEIDEIRFWSLAEILQQLGTGILSDNFEHEISLYMQHVNKKPD